MNIGVPSHIDHVLKDAASAVDRAEQNVSLCEMELAEGRQRLEAARELLAYWQALAPTSVSS